MRILILAGVAAAALTLTACNREDPADTTATDEAAATADTGSMSSGGSTGSMSSSAGTASGSDGSAGSMSGEASMPAQEPVEAPTSEATRMGAKEKAESTNLHPPTN